MGSLLLDAAISFTKFDNAGYRQKIVVVFVIFVADQQHFCSREMTNNL